MRSSAVEMPLNKPLWPILEQDLPILSYLLSKLLKVKPKIRELLVKLRKVTCKEPISALNAQL